MDKKLFKVEVKEIAEGKVRIIFATLNVIDKDGDITEPGAFGKQLSHMLPMHVWTDADPPFIGIAEISETDRHAVADIEINMGLKRGQDWFSALKFALDRGKTIEWSYGFDIVDSERRTTDGKSVRVLKKLTVHEVSPVVLGAGMGTGTLMTKMWSAEKSTSAEEVQTAIYEAAASMLLPEDTKGWITIEHTYADRVVVFSCVADVTKRYEFDYTADGNIVALSNMRELSADAEKKSEKFADEYGRVLAALVGLTERSKALAALRAEREMKAGRVLSAANHERLTALVNAWREGLADLEKLLLDTDPSRTLDEPKSEKEILDQIAAEADAVLVLSDI